MQVPRELKEDTVRIRSGRGAGTVTRDVCRGEPPNCDPSADHGARRCEKVRAACQSLCDVDEGVSGAFRERMCYGFFSVVGTFWILFFNPFTETSRAFLLSLGGVLRRTRWRV